VLDKVYLKWGRSGKWRGLLVANLGSRVFLTSPQTVKLGPNYYGIRDFYRR
jgi:hypothetical protein